MAAAPPADDSLYMPPWKLPGDCRWVPARTTRSTRASGGRLALHAPALCVDESGAPDTAM
ncbi:hypothetical protein PR002_g32637 [Phytophthora rubi]|uniref:Uncharacterized protein n=1 Tax=Phytophthora rubi TaxID=129364 RepID=A0A6A3G6W6_9STRA|nr:hypothetical protein PR002_g32637 [Phytophthora rubi]